MITYEAEDKTFGLAIKMRVNEFFKNLSPDDKTIIPKTGTRKVYEKAIIILTVFFLLYYLLVFSPFYWWVKLILVTPFAMATAGIGFNIMHPGGHGSFSKNKTVNKAAALTLNFLGGNDVIWDKKHNIMHHTYTNIHAHDEDIELGPVGRLDDSKTWYFYHRWQVYYIWIAYGLGYALWITLLDGLKYIRQKAGQVALEFTFWQHVKFWVSKAVFFFVFAYIPYQVLPHAHFWWGFGLWIFETGLIISVIFQLAHTVDNVVMVNEPHDKKIYMDFYVHEALTTCNFSPKSKFLTWFTGGLNNQIEHHLLSKISDVWYPKIAPIVKETFEEHGYTYHVNETFWQALCAHCRHLINKGRRPNGVKWYTLRYQPNNQRMATAA